MGTVPGNKFQQRLHQLRDWVFAPDPFTLMEAGCLIMKVYDTDTLALEGVPGDLAAKLVKYPGYLFARVRMLDKSTTYLIPFGDPADQILATYGNCALLEGRAGKICYRNLDPQTGCVYPIRQALKQKLPMSKVVETADIGAIVV